jgi:hypothetical protein
VTYALQALQKAWTTNWPVAMLVRREAIDTGVWLSMKFEILIPRPLPSLGSVESVDQISFWGGGSSKWTKEKRGRLPEAGG